MPNQQLAEELLKLIVRKLRKLRKVISSLMGNIWGSIPADVGSSKFNKGIRFLLCAIDIFNKYAWVVSLKDKKNITITNACQQILDESNCNPNKIWAEKSSQFYNRSMKPWLQDNDIEIHSTNNEGKFAVAERFIRTLKNKIYKYLTSVSKNVYTDKLH